MPAPGVDQTDGLAPRLDWHSRSQLPVTPILSAALDAFNEHGYHGTTVRDIAARVHMTVPALYYHHPNKEAILYRLLDMSIDRLQQLCDAAAADAGDDTGERFLNLVEAIVLYMANSTKLASLDPEMRSLGPTLQSTYSAKRRRIEQMLVDVLECGSDEGLFEISSPPETARALLGMYQAIARWYSPTGRTSPAALASTYLDISAHTVGARTEIVALARSERRITPLGRRRG